jgi:DedD protein
MAFFKSRSSGNASADDKNTDGMAAQSLDALRRQARHRLIGATVLVFVAVVGFPLVFDTKPREVAADIRIDMPERDAVRPSQVPAAPASVAKAPVPDDVKAPVSQAPEPEPQTLAKLPDPPIAELKKPEAKPADTKSAPKEEVVNTTKPDAEKSKDDGAPRFIVQVGAFSDEAKVKEVRAKLEKAGYTTYVHVAQTKEGKRTRVRIGPFATKQEAQKVVGKIKSLNFNASVLTL